MQKHLTKSVFATSVPYHIRLLKMLSKRNYKLHMYGRAKHNKHKYMVTKLGPPNNNNGV